MANMTMRAPAGIVPGTKMVLLDGTFVTVDDRGYLSVSPLMRGSLQAIGFTELEEEAERLKWVTGFYGPTNETLTTNFLTVADTLYAHPIRVPNEVTVKSISCNVTTGQAGGVARMGIYASLNGRPGQLIVAAPEVTGLTGAAAGTGTFTTPQALSPGWYWLAGVFSATSTKISVAGISQALTGRVNQLIGNPTAAKALAIATTNLVTGLSGSFTYGALPATMPTMAIRDTAATPAFALEV